MGMMEVAGCVYLLERANTDGKHIVTLQSSIAIPEREMFDCEKVHQSRALCVYRHRLED